MSDPGDASGTYAEIRAAVTEAHRRGLVVFATVNCGIPRTAHAAIPMTPARTVACSIAKRIATCEAAGIPRAAVIARGWAKALSKRENK